jgi:DNA invertase Pin-like site-specific DNA recombinase
MKLVAYLRVSTDTQALDGLGLEVQRSAIRTWAHEGGHRIVLWTSDEGVSGSNGLDNRIGLLDALSALRYGSATALVVYRLDRLARDLIVQETLLGEIKRLGAAVFSTSAAEAAYLTDDPDDPSRKLIRQVLGAVAEYERSMIALRLRSGRRLKAERGGYIGGQVPFGFRSVDRSLVADPAESATRARALELRAEGLSLRQIAARLGEEGLRPKRGARWHPETVRQVLAASQR